MRNFYELEGKYFLNIQTYLNEWTKKLDVFQDGVLNKVKLQSLGSLTQNLWQNFNAERDEKNPIVKDKHYMESASGLQAYSASFLLPNIERVFSLLVKDENSIVLKNFLLHEKEEYVIADFGSGPLSGTIGFICALEFLLQTNTNLFAPKKIKILAVERSEKIFQYGLELLQKSLINKDLFILERLTSVEKITSPIDIALCANIFNEIPVKHRLVNFVNLFNKLNLNGSVLILEPGQEVHAKALGTLRDEFLKSTESCEIISPCAHKNTCPLSNTSSRRDWCWFRHGWNPPELLKEVEKFSKIDHHFLNFSYLFVIKSKVKMNELFYARVVSDKLNAHLEKKASLDYFKNNLEQGDKNEFLSFAEEEYLLKILLCTEDGSLKSALFSQINEDEFKRGLRIARKNTFKFICSERNTF